MNAIAKIGRPKGSSPFSEADKERIVAHVCNEIVLNKRSLSNILRDDPDLCGITLFSQWQRDNEEFRERVAQARELALEAYIEEMIEIADNQKLGHNERRVMLLAREKAAMMLAPRRFNTQRTDITTNGERITPAAQPLDRLEQILQLIALRRAQQAQPGLIDVTPSASLDDVMS